MKTTVQFIAVIVLFEVAGLRFISTTTQVSLHYLLLLAAFVGELMITLIVSRGYTRNNLYQIVKGAE